MRKAIAASLFLSTSALAGPLSIITGDQVSGWAGYTQPYGVYSDPNYSIFNPVALNQIQRWSPQGGTLRMVAGAEQVPQDTTTTNATLLPTNNVLRISEASEAAMANQLHNKLWVGIPVNCRADISNLAAMKQSYAYRKGLALGKLLDNRLGEVEMEYSNELWNAGDQTNGTANLLFSRTDTTLTTPDDFGRTGQEAYKQWMYNLVAFEQGVKDSGSTLKVVGRAPGFIANAYFAQKGIEWIKAQNNPTFNRLLSASRLIVGPYSPGAPSDIGGTAGKTTAQLASQSVSYAQTNWPQWFKQNYDLAKASGMQGLALYETMGLAVGDPNGGQSLMDLNRNAPETRAAEYTILALAADLADGKLDGINSDAGAEMIFEGSGGVPWSPQTGQFSPIEQYGGPTTEKAKAFDDINHNLSSNTDPFAVPEPSAWFLLPLLACRRRRCR